MKRRTRKRLIITTSTFLVLFMGCKLFSNLDAVVVKSGYFTNVITSYPLEAKYTNFGEMEVSSKEFEITHEKFTKFKIWYPKEIESGKQKYPIVLIVNGTGVPYRKFEAVFEHLASWGFVVIGNNDEWTATGISASIMLDTIVSYNSNTQSVFYQKLDLEKIGISGHSQGGAGSFHAVTDYTNGSMYTSMYTASAVSLSMIDKWNIDSTWIYDVGKIKIPYYMVAATGKVDAKTIAPLSSLEDNFNVIHNDKLTIMARRKDVDHGNTLDHADGYMTAWFRFTLQNDSDAAKIFIGATPELGQNSDNWQDVRIKNNE